MTQVLDGSSFTIELLVAIARGLERVSLAPAALERIRVCRVMVEQKLANKEIMHVTNTGIGEFSEVVLTDEHDVSDSERRDAEAMVEKPSNRPNRGKRLPQRFERPSAMPSRTGISRSRWAWTCEMDFCPHFAQ